MNTGFVHYPTLLVCLMSVFCISADHLELTDVMRRCGTAASIEILAVCWGCRVFCSCRSMEVLPLDRIFKTFFLIGLLEIVYALLQLCGVLHNYFCFHPFSGSFENPAIFSMLLSFCMPIGYYYALKSEGREKLFWRISSLLILWFVVLSNSRTALISVALAIGFMSYMESGQIKSLAGRKHFRWLALIGMLVVGVCLYIYKQDSADGRILIWRVSSELVMEKPLWGWGAEGFVSQYMNRQADYFMQHPHSSFSLLAGEVSHPLNEFILVAVNYGLIILIGLLAAILFTFRSIICSLYPERLLIAGLFMVLNVWCLFSYPFMIPFVWLVVLFFVIVAYEPLVVRYSPKFVSICVFCLCLIWGIILFKWYVKEIPRIYIQEESLSEQTDEIVVRYAAMYEDYQENRLFLYNYGALLHYIGRYKESLTVLSQCAQHMADYNVQLLLGDDYQHLGMLDSAIMAYRRAHAMIPSRFLPLYYEMRLYQNIGNMDQAKALAEIIIDKEEKVENSAKVRAIKQRAETVLAE